MSQQHQQDESSGQQHGQQHQLQAENLSPQDKAFIDKYWNNLSHTVKNAKWINQVGQREDHPGQTLVTRSHAVIKHWAAERGATPATVPNDMHGGYLGVMRLNFPGYGGQGLVPTSWDEWLKTFDHGEMVFIFQQQMENGQRSNFFHLASGTSPQK